jgi:DNA repair protein RecN (Recombination protein N)
MTDCGAAMLTGLAIRDVVLIDALDLRFPSGLCALTGETGAGKSILLDALGLGLGARADAKLIRHGRQQAAVAVHFDVGPGHPALDVLREQGLEGDSEGGLLLRRIVTADGRSRAFVNDQPVNVSLLRRLGEMLVEIHGQFDNQRLLDPAAHRALLDAYGGLTADVEACAAAWRAWRAAAEARAGAEADLAQARRDEDFIRHALDELAHLAPKPGEESELAHRRALLMNAEKLSQAIDEAARELAGGAARGGIDALRAALRGLQRVAATAEGRVDGAIAALDRALSEAMEGHALLEKTLADADLDPRQLEGVEERLFALRAQARKHGVPVDDLVRLRDEMARRVSGLEDGEAVLADLRRDEAAAEKRYREATAALSERRSTVAVQLDKAVAEELAPLRLGKARFATRVEPLAPADCGPHGCDRITFEVATNPGAPPGPLGRIASGGELARFTLALKVVLAAADPVPTLIFDEVDSGVGGAVAAAVGERLARLADDVQVLVVTHSPQVAARARHHWRIAKSEAGVGMRTRVEILDAPGRTEEIARMLAGAQVTEEARAAAASLLSGSAA